MQRIFKIIVMCSLIFVSCQDKWDEHYGLTDGDDRNPLGTETMWDIISSDSEYSKFTTMLEMTGMDSVLTKNRILTIWLPSNAYLADSLLDMSETEMKRFVLNHMSPLALYKTKLPGKVIKTLALKTISTKGYGNNIDIEEVKVTNFDILASNGVIHEIAGVLTPTKNMMEYILDGGEEYSQFRDSLFVYNDTVFDKERSFVIGTNEWGQTVYDSVFVIQNSLFVEETDFFYPIMLDLSNEEAPFNIVGMEVDFYDPFLTLFIPSNTVIDSMFREQESYFKSIGEEMTSQDSASCFKFILQASFATGDRYISSGTQAVQTIGGEILRFDGYQSLEIPEKCSNGIVYPYERLYMPKKALMRTLHFTPTNMFNLPKEEWAKYYYYDGAPLNNEVTNSAADVTGSKNIFIDNKAADRSFLNVAAKEDEFIDLNLFSTSLTGEITPMKLRPGSYRITARGYGWYSSDLKLSLNGTTIPFSATGADYIPFGSNAHFDYASMEEVNASFYVLPSQRKDVLRLTSKGTGTDVEGGGEKEVNIIRLMEIRFEPTGDNY